MRLLSSGHGPTGWSRNRIWKAKCRGAAAPLVVKVGDGPMSDLVVREIDLVAKVLPEIHPHLPLVHDMARQPVPYIVMEHLNPVSLQQDLTQTPASLLQELGDILPSILLAHRGDGLLAELPGKKQATGIPSTLSYGYLNLRNLGRRPDGTLVVFDWDGACLAPLGSDFKLFREHIAFPDAMRIFHGHCCDCGQRLPACMAWLETLDGMWNDEDNEFRISQQPAQRDAVSRAR
jgi:hypothetical protein